MKNNQMVTKEGRSRVRANDEFDQDLHQAVMNVAYDDWQKNKDWSFGMMLDNARSKYGELFFVFILLGKYNQQVCNGGHVQYYDNGCCDRESRGCMSAHDPSIPLHLEMIEAFEDMIKVLATPSERACFSTPIEIMREFKVEVDDQRMIRELCDDCGGRGCAGCDGIGTIEVDNEYRGMITNCETLDALDTRWYRLNDHFMNRLNDFLKRNEFFD